MDSFYLGRWTVEPQRNCLIDGRTGAERLLDSKAMEVLVVLAEAVPRVVSHKALLEAVWPGASVSDEVLTTSIWQLRAALDDDAARPLFIETVPGRGFRVVAPVRSTSDIDARETTFAAGVRGSRWLGALGTILILLGFTGWVVSSWQERSKRDDSAVEPGLRDLDSETVDSYLDKARLAVEALDWDAADLASSRAVEADPASALAHDRRAWLLALTGRSAEAEEAIERARSLDPASPAIRRTEIEIHFLARRFTEAATAARGMLDDQPEDPVAGLFLGLSYAELGRSAEAAAAALDRVPRRNEFLGSLGYGYARSERRQDARDLLEQIDQIDQIDQSEQSEQSEGPGPSAPFDRALIHVGLGEVDRAILWLENAVRERAPERIRLGVDPRFDPLRDRSRFIELLGELGLQP